MGWGPPSTTPFCLTDACVDFLKDSKVIFDRTSNIADQHSRPRYWVEWFVIKDFTDLTLLLEVVGF